MFRRSRETRAAAQTTPPTQEVAQDSAAIKADSLSDVSQSSSRGSLQDQPADKARPNSATSSRSHLRSDQPHKSVGVQTDVTGEVKPKKRRRRRTCGICLNRWTAIFVAFLAVIWRYEQQVRHKAKGNCALDSCALLSLSSWTPDELFSLSLLCPWNCACTMHLW